LFEQYKQIVLGAFESPTLVITGGEDHPSQDLTWSMPAWHLTWPQPHQSA
jgi:hypothetical protein